MPQKIRMWGITNDNTLTELLSKTIRLEEHLEDWLESDISILDEGLLVIGRQVPTAYGGYLDLLCLDSVGDTVVVELKKGRSPRDVTAQALDYASWVKDLTDDEIKHIASRHSKIETSLEEAFAEKFEEPWPSNLNENHRVLIVAESLDDSTERIVRYLSDLHVPINVATVQHFTDQEGKELLAQVYLVEPEVAEVKRQPGSRRRRPTKAEVEAVAETNGLSELFDLIDSGVRETLEARPSSSPTEGIYVRYQATLADGRKRAVLYVYPDSKDENSGLRYRIQASWLTDHLKVDLDALKSWLPSNSEQIDASKWVGSSPAERFGAIGLTGAFQTKQQVDNFTAGLRGGVEGSFADLA